MQARSLYLPFFKAPVIANMGWFTFIFFALVIVGSSNAVNLTDGLDGLAIGCTITVALAYALLSYAAGNFRIAEYLQVPFYPFTGELTVFAARWSARASVFSGLIVTRRKFSWATPARSPSAG